MSNLPDAFAVRAVDLRRSFGSIQALRGVSLDVPKGSIHGLLGPNGAGKTTLFRILTGQLKPDGGRGEVAGLDVVAERSELRRRIGVLFEMQNLYPRLSVRENLVLFAALYGVAVSVVDELLRKFDLFDRRNSKVDTLSNGMRQKVLIARALLHQPEVLFLDEPTTGLDPNWSLEVQELIRGVRDADATVVLATHQMETADALCDTVSIIDRGSLVANDTPRALKRRLGKRSLLVETGANGAIRGDRIPFDDESSAVRIAAALRDRTLVSIHSEEATLDDVFRQLTGKSLKEALS